MSRREVCGVFVCLWERECVRVCVTVCGVSGSVYRSVHLLCRNWHKTDQQTKRRSCKTFSFFFFLLNRRPVNEQGCNQTTESIRIQEKIASLFTGEQHDQSCVCKNLKTKNPIPFAKSLTQKTMIFAAVTSSSFTLLNSISHVCFPRGTPVQPPCMKYNPEKLCGSAENSAFSPLFAASC